MTSTSTIRTEQQDFTGRTVRDVVEYRHELVNEVWCRKIFRQVLQSLESQYAAQMPHRAITPDTIVIQENGEPMLLPSDRQAAEQGIPADLHALACVIHYAITLELTPQGPLRGRVREGYSDSLLGAVDRCLAPDPRERPHSIDELRRLLGIVSMGPPVSLAPRPVAPAPTLVPPTVRGAGGQLGKFQRWLLIGLAALVLLAAVMALLALLRGTASRDAVVLTLPPQHTAQGLDPNETLVNAPRPAALPPVARDPVPEPAPASPASSGTVDAPARAPLRPAARPAPRSPAPRAAPASTQTTYKLMVKPWGTVYVDGQERGVSPPLKRLALPAGQHTVRLVNPSFPDRVIKVDAGRSQYGRIAHDFSAQ
jgi:hypothetical protein